MSKPLDTLTKQQIFDLQIKYQHLAPHKGGGGLIETWWYDCYAWINVSMNSKLNREFEFVKEFKDYLVWSTISYYQTLSEEFIREFKDYVKWETILKRQYLSQEFIEEMKKEGYIKQ